VASEEMVNCSYVIDSRYPPPWWHLVSSRLAFSILALRRWAEVLVMSVLQFLNMYVPSPSPQVLKGVDGQPQLQCHECCADHTPLCGENGEVQRGRFFSVKFAETVRSCGCSAYRLYSHHVRVACARICVCVYVCVCMLLRVLTCVYVP